jgi:hypothetical protein
MRAAIGRTPVRRRRGVAAGKRAAVRARNRSVNNRKSGSANVIWYARRAVPRYNLITCMSALFPDLPDYAAFPTLFTEAARLNMLPRLIAALLLASLLAADVEHEKHQPHAHVDEFVLAPRSGDVSVRLTGVSATASIGTLAPGLIPPAEMPPLVQPHTHSETEDPLPTASHFDNVASTSSGRAVPFFGNSQDVANDIIRRAWDTQRRAHYAMMNSSSSMSPALWEFASRAASRASRLDPAEVLRAE